MPHARTTVSVTGFTEAEVAAGLPALLEEFEHRPYLLNPSARWDAERGRLVITVEEEGSDLERAAQLALDDLGDCVIACFNFASEGIHFDIDGSEVVP